MKMKEKKSGGRRSKAKHNSKSQREKHRHKKAANKGNPRVISKKPKEGRIMRRRITERRRKKDSQIENQKIRSKRSKAKEIGTTPRGKITIPICAGKGRSEIPKGGVDGS